MTDPLDGPVDTFATAMVSFAKDVDGYIREVNDWIGVTVIPPLMEATVNGLFGDYPKADIGKLTQVVDLMSRHQDDTYEFQSTTGKLAETIQAGYHGGAADEFGLMMSEFAASVLSLGASAGSISQGMSQYLQSVVLTKNSYQGNLVAMSFEVVFSLARAGMSLGESLLEIPVVLTATGVVLRRLFAQALKRVAEITIRDLTKAFTWDAAKMAAGRALTGLGHMATGLGHLGMDAGRAAAVGLMHLPQHLRPSAIVGRAMSGEVQKGLIREAITNGLSREAIQALKSRVVTREIAEQITTRLSGKAVTAGTRVPDELRSVITAATEHAFEEGGVTVRGVLGKRVAGYTLFGGGIGAAVDLGAQGMTWYQTGGAYHINLLNTGASAVGAGLGGSTLGFATTLRGSMVTGAVGGVLGQVGSGEIGQFSEVFDPAARSARGGSSDNPLGWDVLKDAAWGGAVGGLHAKTTGETGWSDVRLAASELRVAVRDLPEIVQRDLGRFISPSPTVTPTIGGNAAPVSGETTRVTPGTQDGGSTINGRAGSTVREGSTTPSAEEPQGRSGSENFSSRTRSSSDTGETTRGKAEPSAETASGQKETAPSRRPAATAVAGGSAGTDGRPAHATGEASTGTRGDAPEREHTSTTRTGEHRAENTSGGSTSDGIRVTDRRSSADAVQGIGEHSSGTAVQNESRHQTHGETGTDGHRPGEATTSRDEVKVSDHRASAADPRHRFGPEEPPARTTRWPDAARDVAVQGLREFRQTGHLTVDRESGVFTLTSADGQTVQVTLTLDDNLPAGTYEVRPGHFDLTTQTTPAEIRIATEVSADITELSGTGRHMMGQALDFLFTHSPVVEPGSVSAVHGHTAPPRGAAEPQREGTIWRSLPRRIPVIEGAVVAEGTTDHGQALRDAVDRRREEPRPDSTALPDRRRVVAITGDPAEGMVLAQFEDGSRIAVGIGVDPRVTPGHVVVDAGWWLADADGTSHQVAEAGILIGEGATPAELDRLLDAGLRALADGLPGHGQPHRLLDPEHLARTPPEPINGEITVRQETADHSAEVTGDVENYLRGLDTRVTPVSVTTPSTPALGDFVPLRRTDGEIPHLPSSVEVGEHSVRLHYDDVTVDAVVIVEADRPAGTYQVMPPRVDERGVQVTPAQLRLSGQVPEDPVQQRFLTRLLTRQALGDLHASIQGMGTLTDGTVALRLDPAVAAVRLVLADNVPGADVVADPFAAEAGQPGDARRFSIRLPDAETFRADAETVLTALTDSGLRLDSTALAWDTGDPGIVTAWVDPNSGHTMVVRLETPEATTARQHAAGLEGRPRREVLDGVLPPQDTENIRLPETTRPNGWEAPHVAADPERPGQERIVLRDRTLDEIVAAYGPEGTGRLRIAEAWTGENPHLAILDLVNDVAFRPDVAVRTESGLWIARGERRGVVIDVVISPDGIIETARPVPGPHVDTVARDPGVTVPDSADPGGMRQSDPEPVPSSVPPRATAALTDVAATVDGAAVVPDAGETRSYTLTVPADGYARHAQGVLDELARRGFEFTGVDIAWGRGDEHGWVTTWTEPGTGETMVVRVTTEEAAAVVRELAEVDRRLAETPRARHLERRWLGALRDQILARTPVPEGADRLRMPDPGAPREGVTTPENSTVRHVLDLSRQAFTGEPGQTPHESPEGLQALRDALPPVGTINVTTGDLEPLRVFAADSFEDFTEEVTLVPFVEGAHYQVVNDRGEPVAMVSLHREIQDLAQRLWAFDRLGRENFQQFHLTEVYGVGMAETPTGGVGVLVTEFAPGSTLSELAERAAGAPDEEWPHHVDTILRFLTKAAKAFAELHVFTRDLTGAEGPAGAFWVETAAEFARQVHAAAVADGRTELIPGDLLPALDRLAQTAVQLPSGWAAALHGDAHGENLRYYRDPVTGHERVTLLDLTRLPQSLDANGTPTGVMTSTFEVNSFAGTLRFGLGELGYLADDLAGHFTHAYETAVRGVAAEGRSPSFEIFQTAQDLVTSYRDLANHPGDATREQVVAGHAETLRRLLGLDPHPTPLGREHPDMANHPERPPLAGIWPQDASVTHILAGDENGGGHRSGTGKPDPAGAATDSGVQGGAPDAVVPDGRDGSAPVGADPAAGAVTGTTTTTTTPEPTRSSWFAGIFRESAPLRFAAEAAAATMDGTRENLARANADYTDALRALDQDDRHLPWAAQRLAELTGLPAAHGMIVDALADVYRLTPPEVRAIVLEPRAVVGGGVVGPPPDLARDIIRPPAADGSVSSEPSSILGLHADETLAMLTEHRQRLEAAAEGAAVRLADALHEWETARAQARELIGEAQRVAVDHGLPEVVARRLVSSALAEIAETADRPPFRPAVDEARLAERFGSQGRRGLRGLAGARRALVSAVHEAEPARRAAEEEYRNAAAALRNARRRLAENRGWAPSRTRGVLDARIDDRVAQALRVQVEFVSVSEEPAGRPAERRPGEVLRQAFERAREREAALGAALDRFERAEQARDQAHADYVESLHDVVVRASGERVRLSEIARRTGLSYTEITEITRRVVTPGTAEVPLRYRLPFVDAVLDGKGFLSRTTRRVLGIDAEVRELMAHLDVIDPDGMDAMRRLLDLGVSPDTAAALFRNRLSTRGMSDIHHHLLSYALDNHYLGAGNEDGDPSRLGRALRWFRNEPRPSLAERQLRYRMERGDEGRILYSPIRERAFGLATGSGAVYYGLVHALRAGLIDGKDILELQGKLADVLMFKMYGELPSALRHMADVGFIGTRWDIGGAQGYQLLMAMMEGAYTEAETTALKEAIGQLLQRQENTIYNRDWVTHLGRVVDGAIRIRTALEEGRIPDPELARRAGALVDFGDGIPDRHRQLEIFERLVANTDTVRELLVAAGHEAMAESLPEIPPDMFNPHFLEKMRATRLTGQMMLLHSDNGWALVDINGLFRAGTPDERGLMPMLALMKHHPEFRDNRITWAHLGVGNWTTLTADHLDWLARMLNGFPGLSYDFSWTPIGQYLRDDPVVFDRFVDFAIEFQDRLIFGSDGISQMPSAHLLRHWTEMESAFVAIMERHPDGERIVAKLAGENYLRRMREAQRDTNQRIVDEYFSDQRAEWDELMAHFPEAKQREYHERAERLREEGWVPNPERAVGPGDWRHNPQIQSSIKAYRIVYGGLKSAEAAKVVVDDLREKTRLAHADRVQELAERDGLHPVDTAEELGLPVTLEALVAAHYALEGTEGLPDAERRALVESVLEAVDSTERERLDSAAIQEALHRYWRRRSLVGWVSTSVVGTAAAAAITMGTHGLTPEAVRLMNGTAFATRSMLMNVRNAHGQELRVTNESIMERERIDFEVPYRLARMLDKLLAYDVRPGGRRFGAQFDDILARVSAQFRDRTHQFMIDYLATTHFRLPEGVTAEGRRTLSVMLFSRWKDYVNRIIGATSDSINWLNPNAGKIGRAFHTIVAGTWIANLVGHATQAFTGAGLVQWVSGTYALVDLTFLATTLPAVWSGYDPTLRPFLRKLHNIAGFGVLTVANAGLVGEYVMQGAWLKAVAATSLTAVTGYLSKLGVNIELKLGRDGAKKGPGATFMAMSALGGIGITVLSDAPIATVAGTVLSVAGPAVYLARGAWARLHTPSQHQPYGGVIQPRGERPELVSVPEQGPGTPDRNVDLNAGEQQPLPWRAAPGAAAIDPARAQTLAENWLRRNGAEPVPGETGEWTVPLHDGTPVRLRVEATADVTEPAVIVGEPVRVLLPRTPADPGQWALLGGVALRTALDSLADTASPVGFGPDGLR
ncbi:hypothetical protein FNH05_06385 [Amycolatopsis rhizosphaerae]|uniref:Uncharacterized protein n=1 Tax=Amycolatopsis rhizosphaerae TaxID=2053003 RepID=A0A558DCE8_9PSEU|nr:hypothetical protein [Amycolatopsis rhizosphaerae]TVT58648.1 hypothetical protein FNH05_06385 [Amycolatopsis rhizosphaerae]